MGLLLLIETSAAVCSVALSRDGYVLSYREEQEPNRHAELLSVFCDEVLREADVSVQQLDAIAVSGGPGSYTGLRIGTSTAKGYCFALGIPLIAVPTLEAMAAGMISSAKEAAVLCPMIDARRMEVYTTLYASDLTELRATEAVILDESDFITTLSDKKILFSGDGMPKARHLLDKIPGASFTVKGIQSAKNLALPAEKRFARNDFADTAYYVPFYLKTFQPGPKRSAK
jgi:tRNA threonylcarbamoyladenosine biosynthesis protein TsaB